MAKTAMGVAYVRAWESSQVDRLFADPYALAFVTAQHRAAGSAGAASVAGHVVLRTRFFDDYLTQSGCDLGCDQVVLVAAGLDTRAYRLGWPEGTTLFELDQPEVLAFKQAVLDRERAVPGCDRRAVPVDLRHDWASALREAGFDPARKTAWLVEGLLIYLTRDEAAALLTTIGELSAPDSRLSFEDSGATPWAVHEYSSWYRGGLGSEALAWLGANGWEPTFFDRAEVAKSYGRDFPGAAGAGFITALRRA